MRSRRLAAVDRYIFPAGVRQRVSAARPDLTLAQLSTVEDAARQWFRLFARHPRGARPVPSVLVAAWWREFARWEREYAEFCGLAVGRVLPVDEVAGGLAVTYRQAREDEPGGLPLIFRVDMEAGVPDARRYVADCGGRGQCWTVPGAVCLQHVGGVGRSVRGTYKGPPPSADWGSDSAGI
jgi:hypothetical protein